MAIEALLEQIRPVSRAAYADCVARFDSIAKPIAGLGDLETLLARVAAVYGDAELDIGKKCVLVFCADNGVVVEGVAQSTTDVTTAIARMMAEQKSSVCVMAKSCGAQVFPVDIGMRDTVPGLLPRKLLPGTGNIAGGPAMTRAQAAAAIGIGAELVRERRAEGFRLVATGEAGIGNTTTAAAVTAVLLDCPAAAVTGRGAGLTDEGLLRKRAAVERAIAVNCPNRGDPLDVLCKIGGLDIAAMTGVFLGGAAYGVPIVMDGVISAVAALCAVRIHPDARDYIIPSHSSNEPASAMLCKELALRPILHAGMRLGEGTGAVALFPLLDMACALYRTGTTFEQIAVGAYERLPC